MRKTILFVVAIILSASTMFDIVWAVNYFPVMNRIIMEKPENQRQPFIDLLVDSISKLEKKYSEKLNETLNNDNIDGILEDNKNVTILNELGKMKTTISKIQWKLYPWTIYYTSNNLGKLEKNKKTIHSVTLKNDEYIQLKICPEDFTWCWYNQELEYKKHLSDIFWAKTYIKKAVTLDQEGVAHWRGINKELNNFDLLISQGEDFLFLQHTYWENKTIETTEVNWYPQLISKNYEKAISFQKKNYENIFTLVETTANEHPELFANTNYASIDWYIPYYTTKDQNKPKHNLLTFYKLFFANKVEIVLDYCPGHWECFDHNTNIKYLYNESMSNRLWKDSYVRFHEGSNSIRTIVKSDEDYFIIGLLGDNSLYTEFISQDIPKIYNFDKNEHTNFFEIIKQELTTLK